MVQKGETLVTMIKKYHITEEEFDAIKEAIRNTLQLWQYDFISAKSEETFFKSLRDEFIVE